jgi:biopolymer transport protein TolQ
VLDNLRAFLVSIDVKLYRQVGSNPDPDSGLTNIPRGFKDFSRLRQQLQREPDTVMDDAVGTGHAAWPSPVKKERSSVEPALSCHRRLHQPVYRSVRVWGGIMNSFRGFGPKSSKPRWLL